LTGESVPVAKPSKELPSESSVQQTVDETVKRIKVPASVHSDVVYSHTLPGASESGGIVPYAGGQLSASGGTIFLDAAVVDPGLIGATELAKLPLAARVEVILAHEVAEASIVKAAGGIASAETHFAAVKAAQFTTLEISAEARSYLKAWSDLSPKAGKGLAPH